MFRLALVVVIIGALVTGCGRAVLSENRSEELENNDSSLSAVNLNAEQAELAFLFGIDHSRLAEQSGEVLDASEVRLYSNSRVNSLILQDNIRAGLDLPYRIQAFHHQGQAQVVYTSSAFLAARHGLKNVAPLRQFDDDLNQLLRGIPNAKSIPGAGITLNYGLVELDSALGFADTVKSLRSAILSEADTVWFYDLDYQREAKLQGVKLPSAQLLVFGAPAPGATAMRAYPSIGLDAFGQKVLVYQQGDTVKVIYNDIPAFATLHYQGSALVHHVIKFRLKQTLAGAIEGQD